MTRFHFVRASSNRKTGPIPVTMTTRDTCPDSCALKGAGCYAESGPLGWHWGKLEKGRIGHGNVLDLVRLCAYIRTIPGGTFWRHNVAGDLPGTGETIDAPALDAIARANRRKRGFTYTHKPMTPENLAAIRAATAKGFTINLSADNAAQADALGVHSLPVVVVIPSDAPKVSHTPAGRKVVQCPAQTSKRVTCATCGLCALPERPYLIGFKPHGTRHKLVNKIANGDTST